MIRFSCLAESKTLHDLLDIKSEIKWMEVLKSISPRKTFFSEASRRYQLGFTRSNYFLALFRHMEMLIRININFFKF